MRKIFALIILLLCSITVFSLSSKVEVVAADYYASTQNLEGKALLNELATISQKNHTYFTSYGELRNNYAPDQDPNNPANLLDFYSKISVKGAWDGGNTWNREHVWPKSLSGGTYEDNKAGADVHHIRPTINQINSDRGNKKFTDFDYTDTFSSVKEKERFLLALEEYTDTVYKDMSESFIVDSKLNLSVNDDKYKISTNFTCIDFIGEKQEINTNIF